MMIPFNVPLRTAKQRAYIDNVLDSGRLAGGGPFGERCEAWFERHLGSPRALLMASCTQALEVAAQLLDVQPGDEVIMPSFTFVSSANAFALRGARLVFVDIRPDTLNIDETLIEAAITPRTKGVVVVHYAGVGCAMDAIMALAERHRLWVVEDAAQGMMGRWAGRPLGGIGTLGAYSFHETKNYNSGGEGGLLIVNDPQLVARAEIFRDKGTDRRQYQQGLVDKYTWQALGSSCLLAELQAACLLAQLEQATAINDARLASWQRYRARLGPLAAAGHIALPVIPDEVEHNAHMFAIRLRDAATRQALQRYLNEQGIAACFHYIPLHTSKAGRQFGHFVGSDRFTTSESGRLLRLPLWYGLPADDQERLACRLEDFFR